MPDYRFNISLDTFDASLLPSGSPAKGSRDYAAAVHAFLRRQLEDFKGKARIVVSEDSVLLEWTPPPQMHDPIEAAVAKLESGETVPGIVMLELLRQTHPDDVRLLYNLGLAYSNLGRLEEAEATLGQSVRLNPRHVNSRVALGVVYAKAGRNEEAVKVLEQAIAIDPNNPWAHRNLGGCLLALREVERAIGCFQRATELNPQDQQAFFGLGEACRVAGNLEEADDAYRQVVTIDEFNPLAEKAKRQLSALARIGYVRRGGTTGHPDAVMHCLSALERFAKLPDSEVQKITFEVAMLGTKGFEIDDPDQQYELQSIPGKFSGLQMVCMMYVGFKRIAPDYPTSFDLSEEYARALEMFRKRREQKS